MTPPFLPGEVALLQAINGAHSPFLDAAMYLISNVGAWTFPAIALLLFLFYHRPKSEVLLLLLMVGLCVAVGDFLSSWVAKPFFARLRPTHTPWLQDSLHYVYGYRGKLYGFFSGHSANYTAVVTLLCLTFRDRRFTLVLSLLVGWVIYSRMYIGAHFLSDCLVGVIVGWGIGYVLHRLYLYLRTRFLATGYRSTVELYREGMSLLVIALWASIPVTLMMALQFTHLLRMVGVL